MVKAQEVGHPLGDKLDFESIVNIKDIIGIWELDTITHIQSEPDGNRISYDPDRIPFSNDERLVWEVRADSTLVQYLKQSPNREADIIEMDLELHPGHFTIRLENASHPHRSIFGRYFLSNESKGNRLILFTNCYPFLGYSARRYVFKRSRARIKYRGLLRFQNKRIRNLIEKEYHTARHQDVYLERGVPFASTISSMEVYKVDRGRYRLKATTKEDSRESILEFVDKSRRRKLTEPL